MDFYDLAKNRYSERKFSDRPVEQDKLDRILDIGRLGPTAGNTQPQRFYLIRTKDAMERAESVMMTPMFGAPVSILVCYDMKRAWKNQFEKAIPNYHSAEQDSAIAGATMMYEAEELGLHSIWMRGFDSGRIREIFGLPENIIPAFVLAIGYASEKSKPAAMHGKRLPIEEYVTELCPEGAGSVKYKKETFRTAMKKHRGGEYVLRKLINKAVGNKQGGKLHGKNDHSR